MELISREDAIDALCKAVDNKGMFEGEWLYTDEFVKVMQSLPTIEERKEGEWIFKTVFPNGKAEFPMGYLVCSVCGSHHSNSTPCNYCDNCGAKMENNKESL